MHENADGSRRFTSGTTYVVTLVSVRQYVCLLGRVLVTTAMGHRPWAT